jgi:K+-sensing histidine kinase KdpD
MKKRLRMKKTINLRTARLMKEIEQFRIKSRRGRVGRSRPEEPELISPRPSTLFTTARILKGISRDFNNLLTCIQGSVSLALLDMDSCHPGYKNLKDIEKFVQKGAALTKQLSMTEEAIKPKRGTTNLNALIRTYFQDLGTDKGRFVFHQRYQSGIWAVKADHVDIERVIRKIHDNSSRSAAAGGDVYIRTQNVILGEAYVRHRGVKPGKFVKISISYADSVEGEGSSEVPDKGTVGVHDLIEKNGGFLHTFKDEENGQTVDLYFPA